MKSIIPYTKEIKFDGKIATICSISLEHELNTKDTEIEGNFIVSGDYKTHEISINKEKFLYKLPFSVEVTDSIVKDSIDFEITDFTYEILNQDTLKVNIEFSVSAEEMEKVSEKEESEEPMSREAIVEEVNDLFLESEEEPLQTPSEKVEEMPVQEEIKEVKVEKEVVEERLDPHSAELVLDSATHKEDEFTTYSIHLVKSGDTLESIVSTYQTDLSILKRYNNLDTMNTGDKIIIPSFDE